jgi:hypothetical protein
VEPYRVLRPPPQPDPPEQAEQPRKKARKKTAQ